MTDFQDFDSLSDRQIRELAKQKRIPGAAKLNPQEILRLLRSFQALEAKPKTELLALLKAYEIRNLREAPKNHLALIALQAARYNQANQAELLRIARKAGLFLNHLEKKDIVKRLLTNYASQLRADALLVDHDSKIPKKASGFRDRSLKSWIGRAVQFMCTVGIVLDMLGILLVPFLAARISSWADERMISMVQETMQLSGSIRQINVTINNGVVVLGTAETTIRGIESTIADTGPLIESSASLIGDHAPQIIDDTRDALVVAEEGARAIDQVLRNLSKISFLTGVSYAPETPLDEAISEVTDSLEPLPEALRQIGDELGQTHSGIEDVGSVLAIAGDELKVFTEELGSKDKALVELADDLQVLSEELDKARGTIHLVVLVGAIFLELFLVGHVTGQAAIFYVGREMATQNDQ